MKAIARLALFGVAALLAAPATAQLQTQGPAPGQLDGEFPYAPPPSFVDPSRRPQQQPGANDLPGPQVTEVPDEIPPPADLVPEPTPEAAPDLAPDDAIADSYDDGYDAQAYTQFEDALSPYGSWEDDAGYGRLWVPAVAIVGADFSPYASSGHWILTEYGWTWVSDWSWGWAPFHYGRWLAVGGRGWCWLPGTSWGPAWVSWRAGGGYVGWAPLPPRGVSVPAGTGPRSPWRFTQLATLGAAHPSYASPRTIPSLFGRTTVVANDRLLTRGPYTVHVNAGPVRGVTTAPVRLAAVAPRALPTLAILPRGGTSIGTRPWAHPAATTARSWTAAATPTRGYTPGTANRAPRTAYNEAPQPARSFGSARPANDLGAQPARSFPSQPARGFTSESAYRAPQPAYHAAQPAYRVQPTYHAPQPAYRATQPTFAAPQPAYRQPSYAPPPVYRTPQAAYHAAAPASSPPPPQQAAFPAPVFRAPAPQPSYAPAPHFGNTGGGAAPFGGGAHFGGAPAGGGGARFGGGQRR